MDNALLNEPTARPELCGKRMTLADAATKGALAVDNFGPYSIGGKHYPVFPEGLAAFAADGPGSKLAGVIAEMHRARCARIGNSQRDREPAWDRGVSDEAEWRPCVPVGSWPWIFGGGRSCCWGTSAPSRSPKQFAAWSRSAHASWTL